MTQRTSEGTYQCKPPCASQLLPASAGATRGRGGRRTLQDRIELMLGIPSTVNELACLLNAPRRIVHATLHNLKKHGKAAVITKKYEDSTCRGRRCERHMAVWGTPGFRLTGFIKVQK